MFKAFEGENPAELLKYSYRWLRKVDTFDQFEVWASDSSNMPKDRVVSDAELEKLRQAREQAMMM